MARTYFLGWLSFFWTVLTGSAQVPVTAPTAATSLACAVPCQVVQLLQAFQQAKGIPGFQVAVSVKGQTVLSEGIGFADVAKQLPVTTTTQFRIGSLSKALTSVALLKLVSEHRLDLDAPVQQYVPSFPVKSYPITTRELAGHLAGIRHYRANDPHDVIRTDHYLTATQALSLFADDPLLAPPGTQYHYSSFGWNLIGAVIEGASGQPFLAYMQQHIWLPLGMMHTYGDRADSLMPNRSQFYGVAGKLVRYDDLSYKYPSGGLLSTAEDLVKYGNSLLNKDLFKPSLTKLLFTSQTNRGGTPTHYGMGWHINVDRNGHRLYWHDGLVLGGSGYLFIYPDDKIVFAYLANTEQGAGLQAGALASLFIGYKP